MPSRDPARKAGTGGTAGAAGAGRVVAGTARGHRLVAPGEGTRPLGDRVKQTLFAILEPAIRGRPFLDLFAGSGAAGIEALSRGASTATFVERDPGAIRVIEANLASTGLGGSHARTVRAEAIGWLRVATGQRDRERPGGGGAAAPFAAILIDPPYDRPADLVEALAAISDAGPGVILDEDGLAVAKHFSKNVLPEFGLLRSVRERRFGETTLTFLRWTSAGADDESEEDG